MRQAYTSACLICFGDFSVRLNGQCHYVIQNVHSSRYFFAFTGSSVSSKLTDKLDPIKIEHGMAAQLILTFDDSTKAP
jgi:hypothetical protein